MGLFFPSMFLLCSRCCLGFSQIWGPFNQTSTLLSQIMTLICFGDPLQKWNSPENSVSLWGDKVSRGVDNLLFQEHSVWYLGSPRLGSPLGKDELKREAHSPLSPMDAAPLEHSKGNVWALRASIKKYCMLSDLTLLLPNHFPSSEYCQEVQGEGVWRVDFF